MYMSVLRALLLLLLTRSTRDPIIAVDVLEEYDFIVVGSGSSGSVVASRLSENKNVTVLLLEAGPSDFRNPTVLVPSQSYINSSLDWNYDLAAPNYSIRNTGEVAARTWPTGKVLGGTSSINGMIYLRGSPHDFNSWRAHGAKGWSWKEVEPYFKKIEHVVNEGRILSKNLGRDGQMKITPGYVSPMSKIEIKAAREIGIPYVDHNDNMEGIANYAVNIYEGFRQSSATAYLRPAFPARKDRLHIVTNAHVTKVLVDSVGSKRNKKAWGLMYHKNGKYKTVRCRREVILSAGVVGTPRILLLSGMGPKKHLEDIGIKVIKDIPGVGSNMQDHFAALVGYRVRNLPKDYTITPGTIERTTAEYIANGTGPILVGFSDTSIYARTKYAGTGVSASTRKHPFPDAQVYLVNQQFPLHYATDNGIGTSHLSAGPSIQHPKSKGTIRLRTTDPFQQPTIDPNFLSNEDDVLIITEGFRILEKLEASKTLKAMGLEMMLPSVCNGTANFQIPRSNEFLRCITTEIGYSAYHPCCTAKIGRKSDKMSVLDERLRVRGVKGLRVADASAMPHLPSGNTQAPCMMIGEKAAAMIKEDWEMNNR